MKRKELINRLKDQFVRVHAMLSPNQIKDIHKNGKHYFYLINDYPYVITDTLNTKICVSENYNFTFDKTNGDFKRWGKNYNDDPDFSPVGPEILDLEISINGCPNNCRFCYKNNTNKPATNMTFDSFKSIVDKFTKSLTQIAFGITGIQTNPDFIRMMEYCREIGVVPNFTLSGVDLTDEMAEKCSKIVGALAVSAYESDKNVCYNSVKKFTDLGLTQTNIHLLVSAETLPFVYEVLNDRLTDSRLQEMHAIVFLGVKPKGRAKDNYHSLPVDKYKDLIKFCFDKKLAIGFDSCSAPKFEEAIRGMNLTDEQKKHLIQCSESCESSLFSSYINFDQKYWHCSFAEGEDGEESVDVGKAENFLQDVWYSPQVIKFRNRSINNMINGCRYCHVFPEINK